MENNRGYVIVAMTVEDQNAAALCAYSIKNFNRDASVTLVLPDLSKAVKQFEEPFDYIIELPFTVNRDRRANDWQLWWCSPYDNTIAIDAYSVVGVNHESLWSHVTQNFNVCFSTSRLHFNGQHINLPDESLYAEKEVSWINSSMFYFDKSNESLNYFKLADPVMRDWKTAMQKLTEPKYQSTKYNSDLMHSLLVNVSRTPENLKTADADIFSLYDMGYLNEIFKSQSRIKKSWTEYINVWPMYGSRFKVQNYIISGVFHYHDPEFITEEIYDSYRDYFRENRIKENPKVVG